MQPSNDKLTPMNIVNMVFDKHKLNHHFKSNSFRLAALEVMRVWTQARNYYSKDSFHPWAIEYSTDGWKTKYIMHVKAKFVYKIDEGTINADGIEIEFGYTIGNIYLDYIKEQKENED